MLARKKAAKKSAIASHSSAVTSAAPKKAASAAVAAAGKGKGKGKKESAEPVGARRPMTRGDVQDVATESSRADLIRSIGDNVNTRLLNLHNNSTNDDDDIDDSIAHEEKKFQLMEEARLAAGMQQRVVSSHIEAYYHSTTTPAVKGRKGAAVEALAAGGLATVRVRHNCNAITAVAALGVDVLVLGDKSGKVYMVDLSSAPDAPSLFATQRAAEREAAEEAQRRAIKGGRGTAAAATSSSVSGGKTQVDLSGYKRRRKMMLEPALPKAIVSLAISDTRGNRPTTRDLFEKTTVDLTCPSYTVAGAEDGSIAVWETFTQRHKGLLFMHRKAVTALSFRVNTAELYSASDDGTLRVWSVPQMLSVDKLFGHEGKVRDMHGLKRETCASVGDDGTLRFWKIDAATQQSYTYTVGQREEALAAGAASGELVVVGAAADATTATATATSSSTIAVHLECVAMVNESVIVAGAEDGSLVLFDVNRRKPLFIVPAAHGFASLADGTGIEQMAVRYESTLEVCEGGGGGGADAAVRALLSGVTAIERADAKGKGKSSGKQSAAAAAAPRVYDRRRIANTISAVAAVPYADVIASASYDGTVRLWHVRGVGGGSAVSGRRTQLNATGGDNSNSDERQPPALVLLAKIPMSALVTSVRFSADGDCLFVGCSKECRRGRWTVCRAAQNGVAVVPLTANGARMFLQQGEAAASVLSVEHVPAQLYSFQEGEDGADGEEEAAAAQDKKADAAKGKGKKPAPGANLEVEFLDDEEDDEDADLSGIDHMAGDDEDEEIGAPSGGSSGSAFFAVGKDGQLVFTNTKAAPDSIIASDVMKARRGAAPAGKKVVKKAQRIAAPSAAAATAAAASPLKAKKKKLTAVSPSSSKKAPLKKKAKK